MRLLGPLFCDSTFQLFSAFPAVLTILDSLLVSDQVVALGWHLVRFEGNHGRDLCQLTVKQCFIISD